MPTYIYRARDERGQLVKGTMVALSADDLAAKLRRMGYMTTSVALFMPGINLGDAVERFRPIRTQDLVIFNFQLANLIESGIPILAALSAIEVQIENKKLKAIIGDVRRNIEAGGYFSASLSNHRAVFGQLFISMVKAGEESGKLDKVLRRYALYVEEQEEFRAKIRGALFYPALLFAASIFVITFIVTFIIPQFIVLFSKSGVKVPLITNLLYIGGLFIKRYWYLVILGCLIALFGFRKYQRSQLGRLQLDRIALKALILGPFLRKVYVSRFARTFSTLLSSGVPILVSLDIVKEVVNNTVLAEAIVNVRRSVEQGQKITEPLKVSKEFPLDAIQMIAVGEETGNLDEMLNKIADFYDLAISYTIKKLSALIEPVFLAVMGGIVAFIMASILTPIFDMVKVLRH